MGSSTRLGDFEVSLCVLASSSSGNCSVVSVRRGGERRVFLIDAGLSPRRTRGLLAQLGVEPTSVEGILFTHLDHDHMHPGWIGAMPESWRVMLHRRHRGRGERAGLLRQRAEVFDGEFEAAGLGVSPLLMSHDELGSAAFRIDCAGRSLGFATDLGKPDQRLVEHLRGVDVLAIESNYCPRMQDASGRPAFLKQRIMGGNGHLSNAQSAGLVRQIQPREHVVLLHLSRQCNHPSLAAASHAHAGYRLTISDHTEPTGWVPVAWPGAGIATPTVKIPRGLFDDVRLAGGGAEHNGSA